MVAGKRKGKYVGNSLTNKEKETHWIKELKVPFTTKQEQKGPVGIWRFQQQVAESIRLQNLAVRSTLVSNCAPCVTRLDYRRTIKFACELHAHPVQCAELVTTRCIIKNKNASHSQILEPGAPSTRNKDVGMFIPLNDAQASTCHLIKLYVLLEINAKLLP
eukprot:1139079-Pelagomonas_calceolata.AAC.1